LCVQPTVSNCSPDVSYETKSQFMPIRSICAKLNCVHKWMR
jgi:hypothetical protein